MSLPVEIVSHILSALSRAELLPCLTVSSKVNEVASRTLYYAIESLRPSQSIACLRTLSHSPHLRPFVHRLELDWNTLSTPLSSTCRLFYTVLTQGLPNLIALSLEFPRIDAPSWILDGCQAELKYFSTSLPCDKRLAEFLDRQHSLVELTLSGFQHGGNNIPPFFTSVYWPTFSPTQYLNAESEPSTGGISVDQEEKHENDFILRTTSLPKLNSLRTLHCGPQIIASVVEGRPIQFASVALFPSLSSESLRALTLSSKPMRRLSVMSFDPSIHGDLLREIGQKFPKLEALHIVILLSEYTNDLLMALGPLLARFKALQYITFMAATDRTTLAGEDSEEHDIAKLWHQWCPTLKTIILPRGRVWFEGRPEWSVLEEES